MARIDIPLVSNGRLLLSDAAEDRQSHILVGSDTWYTWLVLCQGSIDGREPGTRKGYLYSSLHQIKVDRALAAACTLLRRPHVRLLTLTGTGSIGKTRLALQIATALLDDFSDGVYFVALAAITDPDLVMPTIAQKVGLWESGDRPLLEQVQDYLQEKHLLLLLDNFEQVIAAAPQLVDLLVSCPHLSILVTSRAALHLSVERAQAVKAGFQLTEANAHAIAEIGELQCGLGNTLQWSYDLLSAEEQRLFRRLCVFVGGCTLEAAETICHDLGVSVLDGVASLIDKSWLYQTEQTDCEPRLVMLETIREYGLECLAAQGEMEATRQVHAAYYLALAEEAAPKLQGPQQAAWLERLEREHDNLRAALWWYLERNGGGSSREMALRLGGALWTFWSARGLSSEGRTELSRALVGSEGVAASIRAKALSAAADFALLQSVDDRTEALCQESLVLYRKVGDTRGIASSLSLLAWVARRKRGDFTAARSLIEESLALYREVGDKDAIAWSLFSLADNAGLQGEYTRGRALLEESLATYRELGNKRGIAISLKQLALWLFVAQGDQEIIRAWLEESLTLFRELGDKDGMAYYYWISGWVALSQGDTVTAQALVEQSLALWREIGNRWNTVLSFGILGKIATHRGALVAARVLHEESLAIARASGDIWLTPFCLEELASVVAAQGELVWAARLWGAADALRDTTGSLLPSVFRENYELSVATAHTHLGEKAFATAWSKGRTMTPEQAITVQDHAVIPTSTPAGSLSTAPAKSPTTYPDGLTPRQVEVLSLVAQGMTNRQVAEQLIISPRTVNTHLTSIYRKIDVNSRGAATRYVMERHLEVIRKLC